MSCTLETPAYKSRSPVNQRPARYLGIPGAYRRLDAARTNVRVGPAAKRCRTFPCHGCR